jgi:putative addiction module component (TIGR02574 family)
MTQLAEAVFHAALTLPPENRAELAEKLLKSLEDPEREAIDQAWAEEAERRLEVFLEGNQKAIPGEEVLKKLPCRLSRIN